MVIVDGYSVRREGKNRFIVGCFSPADPNNYEEWVFNREGECFEYGGKLRIWMEHDTSHVPIEVPHSAIQALKRYLKEYG